MDRCFTLHKDRAWGQLHRHHLFNTKSPNLENHYTRTNEQSSLSHLLIRVCVVSERTNLVTRHSSNTLHTMSLLHIFDILLSPAKARMRFYLTQTELGWLFDYYLIKRAIVITTVASNKMFTSCNFSVPIFIKELVACFNILLDQQFTAEWKTHISYLCMNCVA